MSMVPSSASPAQLLAEALAALEAGPGRDHAAARALASRTADDAADLLSGLVRLGRGDARVRVALSSLCRVLHFGSDALTEAQRHDIHRSARSRGHGEVVSLFVEAEAQRISDGDRESGPRSSKGPAGNVAGNLASTRGHRTQTARAERNRDRLIRLCADPDPHVIRSLLANPRLTEALVTRIAARRPTVAAVLEEVARAVRWSRSPAVKRALAMNPYSPPALANSVLPDLGAEDLHLITESDLHPAVRAAARALLTARAEGPGAA